MSLAVSIIAAVAFASAFRRPIKAAPWAFYLLALLLAAAGIYLTWFPLPDSGIRALAFAIQKGHLGFAFFAIVMYIGVFPRGSSLRNYFMPIRAQLSIIASILIIGHLVPYLKSYLGMADALFSLQPRLLLSFSLGIVLLLLGSALSITSIQAIKARMEPGRWKMLQKLAYLFFVLIFAHLVGYLIVPATSGSLPALINCLIYLLILLVYIIARLIRWRQSRVSQIEDVG